MYVYFLNIRTMHQTRKRQTTMYIIPSGMDIHGDASDKNDSNCMCFKFTRKIILADNK